MNKVRLPGWSQPVLNAVQWLREQENIPEWEDIEPRFCEYFDCEIEKVGTLGRSERVYAVFDEPAAAVFLLRWS